MPKNVGEQSEEYDYYLKSYVQNGNPKLQKVGNRVYAIQYFQSPHQNEYLMTELKGNIPHGDVQLYEYGVLKLAWTMCNGVRTGVLTMYQDGVVEKELCWENFDSNIPVNREVINESGSNRVLRITHKTSKVLIYRGDCNQLLQRCGKGMEFDLKTGLPLYYGVYKDDKCFHIIKQVIHWNTPEEMSAELRKGGNSDSNSNNGGFGNNNNNGRGLGGGFSFSQRALNEVVSHGKMVEYGGKEEECNTDLVTRKPVYIGGFYFDKSSWTISRSCTGNVVNERSGIASQQILQEVTQFGHHAHGSSSNRLYNGWKCNYEGRISIREMIEEDEQKKKEMPSK